MSLAVSLPACNTVSGGLGHFLLIRHPPALASEPEGERRLRHLYVMQLWCKQCSEAISVLAVRGHMMRLTPPSSCLGLGDQRLDLHALPDMLLCACLLCSCMQQSKASELPCPPGVTAHLLAAVAVKDALPASSLHLVLVT